jgi:hypothetical protein
MDGRISKSALGGATRRHAPVQEPGRQRLQAIVDDVDRRPVDPSDSGAPAGLLAYGDRVFVATTPLRSTANCPTRASDRAGRPPGDGQSACTLQPTGRGVLPFDWQIARSAEAGGRAVSARRRHEAGRAQLWDPAAVWDAGAILSASGAAVRKERADGGPQHVRRRRRGHAGRLLSATSTSTCR